MKRFLFLIVAAVISIGAALASTMVVVDGVHVRLRTAPSTSASVYSNIYGTPIYPAKGARLTYLGTNGNFYEVSFNGYRLFISRDFCHLKQTSGNNYGSSNSARFVIVDGVHVRLRTAPSTNASVYSNRYGTPIYPAKGARLTYLGTDGNFYKVSFNGYPLYISRDYCHLSR